MNIMMLTAYFPPEVGSASHLFYELGGEFVRRGHNVTVLTGYPTYNVDVSALPARYKSGLWLKETIEGMHIVRSRSLQMPRHVPILRGIDQVTTSIAFALAAIFLSNSRPDVILIYSPPLFLGITGLALRMIKGARVVLNVQDLFPQSAIDLGVLRSELLISLFRRVEKYLYKGLDAVAVHSGGNREHVMRCGGSPERAYVVHNPVDTKNVVPGNRKNAFRSHYQIRDEEFVVSFAGVIGYSQDLDTVIGAAALMKDVPDVVFYIVGDGVEKPRLMKLAEGMKNVRFLPMLDRNEYLTLLHASDVCLATLRSEVKTPVVPSKILSIMAAGRPLVAGLPLQGDAPIMIQDAQCGICVEPENAAKLAEAIKTIYADPILAMEYSKRGRAFVEEHCSLEGCANAYQSIFNEITRRKDV
jgi:colanic acid biosynthesis glycosyl transferase WcaI